MQTRSGRKVAAPGPPLAPHVARPSGDVGDVTDDEDERKTAVEADSELLAQSPGNNHPRSLAVSNEKGVAKEDISDKKEGVARDIAANLRTTTADSISRTEMTELESAGTHGYFAHGDDNKQINPEKEEGAKLAGGDAADDLCHSRSDHHDVDRKISDAAASSKPILPATMERRDFLDDGTRIDRNVPWHLHSSPHQAEAAAAESSLGEPSANSKFEHHSNPGGAPVHPWYGQPPRGPLPKSSDPPGWWNPIYPSPRPKFNHPPPYPPPYYHNQQSLPHYGHGIRMERSSSAPNDEQDPPTQTKKKRRSREAAHDQLDGGDGDQGGITRVVANQQAQLSESLPRPAENDQRRSEKYIAPLASTSHDAPFAPTVHYDNSTTFYPPPPAHHYFQPPPYYGGAPHGHPYPYPLPYYYPPRLPIPPPRTSPSPQVRVPPSTAVLTPKRSSQDDEGQFESNLVTDSKQALLQPLLCYSPMTPGAGAIPSPSAIHFAPPNPERPYGQESGIDLGLSMSEQVKRKFDGEGYKAQKAGEDVAEKEIRREADKLRASNRQREAKNHLSSRPSLDIETEAAAVDPRILKREFSADEGEEGKEEQEGEQQSEETSSQQSVSTRASRKRAEITGLHTYVRPLIPSSHELVARREKKNASSRSRAGKLRGYILKLKEKAEDELTAEEKQMINDFDQRRTSKNSRSRARASETKAKVDAILTKPSERRTKLEIAFLEQHVARKQRKNEGDRLRRQRIKELGLDLKLANGSEKRRPRVTARGPLPLLPAGLPQRTSLLPGEPRESSFISSSELKNASSSDSINPSNKMYPEYWPSVSDRPPPWDSGFAYYPTEQRWQEFSVRSSYHHQPPYTVQNYDRSAERFSNRIDDAACDAADPADPAAAGLIEGPTSSSANEKNVSAV